MDVSIRVLRDIGSWGLSSVDLMDFSVFSFCFSALAYLFFGALFRCSWCGDGVLSFLTFFDGSTDTANDLLDDLDVLPFLDVDRDLDCLDLGLLAFAAAVAAPLDPVDLDFFGFLFGRDSRFSDCMIGSPSFFDIVLFHSTNCLSNLSVSRGCGFRFGRNDRCPDCIIGSAFFDGFLSQLTTCLSSSIASEDFNKAAFFFDRP